MSYFVRETQLGATIARVLEYACEVKYGGIWYYVLGYDREVDTLSLMSNDGVEGDFSVENASAAFTCKDIRVGMEVYDRMFEG